MTAAHLAECLPPEWAGPADADRTAERLRGHLDGVLVLADRPDTAQARADEKALAAAGATVRAAGDPGAWAASEGHAPPVFLLLVDADVAMQRPNSSVVPPRAPGDVFRVVVGSDLGSASRTRLLLSGADDCLGGKYLPEELVARAAALLRRRGAGGDGDGDGMLTSAGLTLDTRAQGAQKHGVPLALTHREYELLEYLMRHAGVVLSRERLLSQVWGYDFGSTDTVTVHMRRLRSKIEEDPARPVRILTVRGSGYAFAHNGDGKVGAEFLGS